MKDDNRIKILYNAMTGILKMSAPNSLLLRVGLFILLAGIGLAVLIHQFPPVIHAIAPSGLIH